MNIQSNSIKTRKDFHQVSEMIRPHLENLDIFDQFDEGIYIVSTEGFFIFMNSALRNWLHVQDDPYSEMHFLDTLDKNCHTMARDVFERIMTGENGIPCQFNFTAANGGFIAEVQSNPYREGEKIIGLLGVARRLNNFESTPNNPSNYSGIAPPKETVNQLQSLKLKWNFATFETEAGQGLDSLSSGSLRKIDVIVPVDISCSTMEYADMEVLLGSFRDSSLHARTMDTLKSLIDELRDELSRKNTQLLSKITEHRKAETELRRIEKELHEKSGRIEELNTALKVLLSTRENEKTSIEERVLSNIQDFILPYVEKLKKQGNNSHKIKQYLDILEDNLQKIISPFMHNLKLQYSHFTPKEIEVINYICEGKSTKEIAELLNTSVKTIEFHRDNLRKKFGLKKQKANLRTHLLSIK